MTFQAPQQENKHIYPTDYVHIASVGIELDKEVCEAGKVYAKEDKQRFFGRKVPTT
ncbi:hypothetical protein JCM18694_07290 [Prolixibacter denitrificans]|uniref:Uncharacterized protein n=1 Tax=Prolixibacter denitrificans TaxID=1541063 RepID=A0ABQ0ZGS3_9BACT|nr:hypothetical protein JCM18694_07290 [Prolixibacter denitrificans]